MHSFNSALDMRGMHITIMGLGLHTGGLSSALFCIHQGAEVTVTDYQDEYALAPSIEKLSGYNIRYVLGTHEKEDFTNADLVIKGPSVPRTSPYLEYARHIETDLSLFFRMNRGRLMVITGTKGKSTSASIIDHCLKQAGQQSWLVGNIRQSPLSIWADIQPTDWLIMEMSSFQLGDLAWLAARPPSLFGKLIFDPEISLITNMSIDHQDYYSDFESYRQDKLFLVQAQRPNTWAVINNSELCRPFVEQCKATPILFGHQPSEQHGLGAWYTSTDRNQQQESIFISRPQNSTPSVSTPCNASIVEEIRILRTPLSSTKHLENMAGSALALALLGMHTDTIARGMNSFTGLSHRMELVATVNNIDYVNDSAATVPEATLAAVQCFSKPIILIAGGSNKGVDMLLFTTIAEQVKHIILLEGNASKTIVQHLEQKSLQVAGYCNTMKEAVKYATHLADEGDVVLLSPGATSFGLFPNAYVRGDRFKEAVHKLTTL